MIEAGVVGILVLAYLTWVLLQLFGKEPARTIILVLGLVIALVGYGYVYVGHSHALVVH